MRAEEDIKDKMKLSSARQENHGFRFERNCRKLGIERVEVSAADFENAIALDDVINTETGRSNSRSQQRIVRRQTTANR
jgi:adenylate cyclase